MSAALPMFTEQQLKDALSVAFPFDAEPDGSWTLIESERRISEAVIAARDAQWQAYAQQARDDLEAENKRLREALEKLTHYAECQVAAFSSGRPSLDMTLFPHLCANARAALKEPP